MDIGNIRKDFADHPPLERADLHDDVKNSKMIQQMKKKIPII